MTGDTADRTPPGGQLDAEAAEWCSLMHGPDADRHRSAFQTWLRRGALHREAYNRMEEIYLLGARLPPRMLTEAAPSSSARRSLRALPIAAAAVAVAGLGMMPAARWWRSGHPDADIALLGSDVQLRLSTMRMSSESFRLADGSVVTLGPDSEMAVAYDPRVRRLRLARGRSRFDVAQEPRPFIVEAGAGSVTAEGTSFDVAIDAARNVTVSVRSGAVEVRPAPVDPTGGAAPRRLGSGEEFTYPSPETTYEPTSASRPDAHQASTVGELVAQANARAGRGPKLRLVDPHLAFLAIGGSFRAHEPAVVAERLALMLDLRIRRSNDEILLERR